MSEKDAATKKEPHEGAREAEIDIHWKEADYKLPSAGFIGQANLNDPAVKERFSEKNFPECYREFAELLTWDKYWHTTLDTNNPPFWKWFVGGRLNASYNCVDRHLEKYKNKAAIIFVSEMESEPPVALTYQELYVRVNEFAALLRDFAGIKKGDRITFHMPMVAELPIAMLAAARIGAIHSEVFGGFSGEACGVRIADSGSRVLVTMDAYYRSGKLIDHKANADIAVATAEKLGQKVDKVLVFKRYADKYSSATPMVEGRDFFINDKLKDFAGKRVKPESMASEDPLFMMYTSGTTGKPKGCVHSTGGYLSYVTGTAKWIQDIHPNDVYWCLADIGWITGHSYIVYGPLALAGTTVIYEGTPTFPDAGRLWRIAERLDVNIFHTSPTMIRMLRKSGPDEPAKYNYHFKHMTTVGEPIEPEVWKWYYDVIGKGQAVIVDTWWQTETGGVLCTTMPGLDRMKPGSAGPTVPGLYGVIYDEEGNVIPPGSGKGGNICIRNPWPGFMLTIWNDPDRMVRQYFRKYNKNPNSKDWKDWPYMTGDGAVQSEDGYFRIVGRIDDVIKVAGHRLGTKEIEAACFMVPEVAEAAVIPLEDELRGHLPEVYISLKPGIKPTKEIKDNVILAIEREIGKIARPKNVYLVPDMPKTRSGKIMRRVLAAISNKADTGDTSTLSNPDIVEQIKQVVQGAEVKR
jgi:acetyl-CoA synthetase